MTEKVPRKREDSLGRRWDEDRGAFAPRGWTEVGTTDRWGGGLEVPVGCVTIVFCPTQWSLAPLSFAGTLDWSDEGWRGKNQRHRKGHPEHMSLGRGEGE